MDTKIMVTTLVWLAELWPSIDVYVLVPGTCEYISFFVKRSCADVLKLRNVRLEYPGLPTRARWKQEALHGSKGGGSESEKMLRWKQTAQVWRCLPFGLEVGGRGSQTRESGQPPETGKGKNRRMQRLQKNAAPQSHLGLPTSGP